MSGVIADTLAAHSCWYINDYNDLICDGPDCGWTTTAPLTNREADALHAAHQAEVLAAAGVGDLRPLLDDLRGLVAEADSYDFNIRSYEVRELAARYTPSDPTPKEQQP